MGATGYSSKTAVVGSVQDKYLDKPSGSGVQAITPTIPAAIAQTAAATLPSPAGPFYTRGSSTVLTLTLLNPPGFTTSSKIGVFWTGADGSDNYCLDCTITSITGAVVVITAPTLSAAQLAAGMLYFNGATTTGAGDVTGKKITQGTTVVTFSVATIATADVPNNPDLTEYSLPIANIAQLLVTAGQTGAVEFFVTGAVAFAWQYAYNGNFYSYVTSDTQPWTGTVTALRFYNSSMQAQTISVGVLMA